MPAGLLFEGDSVLDPGLGKDKVSPVGRLLVGREPLVDQVRHLGPFPHGGVEPVCGQTLFSITIGSDWICAALTPRNIRVHWTRTAPVVVRTFADMPAAWPEPRVCPGSRNRELRPVCHGLARWGSHAGIDSRPGMVPSGLYVHRQTSYHALHGNWCGK